ncbi:ABC transporter substrate-binding protein [Kutzneria kofuensis]|uniref:Sorbitol/mannitol transport system substrate-binding protein n=1 Tax=Kutzneria kofuensis TaxID=103725 RepID=A0A7W9NLY4_9PSEU|nr:sugar ABC transporter substrate-binding protein [Kutzneria kofuensis]MBB5898102.1 sorbitol/mannitol transport system substrate-binding protein [Kutzneria kofuensis]
MVALHARLAVRAAVAALAVSGLAACGGDPTDDSSINVLMVNNPQMKDLVKLTADAFTRKTGIRVNYTLLPENDVRDKISEEFSSQAGQYDVATISNYETPIWAKNGWLTPLDRFLPRDTGFDQGDVIESMRQSLTGADGTMYAEPFYGESSFVMYRKDVFAARGLTMPDRPTWQQVAELAAKADGALPGMRGICLRGQPGWGELAGVLTTVVNTFGGTWFTQDWRAQVNAPEFKRATRFYVDLVRDHGEIGAPQAGFTECLNDMTQGRVAIWYDSTAAAGLLEAKDSPVAGKLGYAQAPVVRTASSGWLYTWAFAIEKASGKQDSAWKFISWACGKDYEGLVGASLGWSRVPSGKRASTYQRPECRVSTAPFGAQAEAAIRGATPRDTSVQPRPTSGIGFVDIPEFTDLGTQVSQQVSSAIAGRVTVDAALDTGQALAAKVAAKRRGG